MPQSRVISIICVAACLSGGLAGTGLCQSPEVSPPFREVSGLGLQFTTSDARILLGGSLLTLAAFTHESRQQSGEEIGRYIESPADFGNLYGSAWGAGAVLVGLGAMGIFGGSPRCTNAAIDLSKSLTATALMVWSLKVAIDRTRPNGSNYSFPSGHTATAFTVSTVLERYFGWKVGAPAYAASVLTGLGRIEDNYHYLSDVIAGATIGVLVGRIVPSRYGRVTPYIQGPERGVMLSFQF
jgi:membrane-associated phospholipid phosphatase